MRTAALATVLALSSLNSSAQPTTRDRAVAMLRDWADAVTEHRAGQIDTALSVLDMWSYTDLELMQPFLEAFAGTPERNEDAAAAARRGRLTGRDRNAIRDEVRDRRGADADLFRRRAAILHTDAAILLALPRLTSTPSRRPPVPSWAPRRSERQVDVISKDAEYQSVEYRNPHWEVAMDMVDAIEDSRDAFAGDWFAVIGSYFVEQRRFSDGLAHFDRARRILPEDAGVMFAEARLHEALAAPLMQNFVRVTAVAQNVPVVGIDDQRTELRRAEALLQKAMTRNPSLAEARLRLGRVIMQQQRWEEGLRVIQPLLERTGDASLTYYAHLFAGDAQLAIGRLDEARRSFERALALFPDAQAALLGLAAALRMNGRSQDAIAVLSPLKRDVGERPFKDPWWIYYDRNDAAISAALDALRAPFRQPASRR